MKKWTVLVAMLMALVMVLSACGEGPAPTEGGDTPKPTEGTETTEGEGGEATPKEEEVAGNVDGVLDVCISSEPNSIDPALNTSVDGAVMISHAFEGLIKYVDDGNGHAKTAPGIAESWDVSDDNLTWTFHLRDAKWSDGEPVKAQDFEYAWRRAVDKTTGADYEYMFDMVKGYGDGNGQSLALSCPDDKTFVVELSTLCPYFEEICAFPTANPIRQDIIEASGDQWTLSAETYVSNGPYKMVEWMHNDHILFEKNENYHDQGFAKAEKINFRLMDDQNAIYAAYQNGELDFIEGGQGVPLDEVPALLDKGWLHVYPEIGTYFVCFNTQLEPFNNPDVRRAFSLTIDRNRIVEKITQSGEIPAGGFVPEGINDAEGIGGDDFRTKGGDYYSMDPADYQANCDEARELLKKAGYEGGAGFPVVEYLYNTSESHKAIAEALQNMWQEELGVTVTLQNVDWNVFIDQRKNGDFSIARHGWIADYNDPMTFIDMWITGSGNNDSHYNNPEYDNLVKAAKAETDAAKRMETIHKAEDILMGESVVAPIYFYTSSHMIKPNLQGLYYNPLGYYYYSQITGF